MTLSKACFELATAGGCLSLSVKRRSRASALLRSAIPLPASAAPISGAGPNDVLERLRVPVGRPTPFARVFEWTRLCPSPLAGNWAIHHHFDLDAAC